jgi:predicted PurR-regulated permease PerM
VVILGLIVLGALMIGLVLAGISSESASINASMSDALDKLQGWLHDLGISSASTATDEIRTAVPAVGHTLLKGVAGGISGLASLLVFLGFTAFAAFFLLKDGPTIGRWIERHMGMKPAEASVVMTDVIRALRKYFLGLTIIAGLSTAGVVLGALILGVPLLGTIAIVSFLASYVPIVGAWTAGIFVFAITLADQGTTSALIMALIVFLSNGPLQQIVQPVVYGAALRLNPLVVFSVTIAAGTLFGMAGMVLAAPLVSAAVRIHDDLARLRASPNDDGTAPAGSGGVSPDVLQQI